MSCGTCTACCTMFPVKWLNKGINTPCRYCDNGCLIQDTKDKECSDFDCAYIQSGAKNESLRPDNCGVIFEKLSDSIIYGTLVPDMQVTSMAKNQVNAFAAQGFSVVLASINEITNKFIIGEGHDESAIRQEFSELIHGHLRN